MATYKWKDDRAKMLRALRMSRTLKIKYGWRRDSGAGFIREDINSVSLDGKKIILSLFDPECPYTQSVDCEDLNLRETEVLIDYLEKGGDVF